jgi:hypothetical protein
MEKRPVIAQETVGGVCDDKGGSLIELFGVIETVMCPCVKSQTIMY